MVAQGGRQLTRGPGTRGAGPPARSRTALALGAAGLVVVCVVGYLAVAGAGRPGTPGDAAPGALLVVDQTGGSSEVVALDPADPGGPRTATGLRCQRVYAAAGTTSCLRLSGPGPTFEAAVLDPAGEQVAAVALPGIPSRTRVSASGRIVSWTVFVTGDSYLAPGGFSTRTGFLDRDTGELVESLEGFSATLDGVAHGAADTNYWGMTVAADDRTFYATLASGDRHWLVRGDLRARTVESVREGAECPSLSPDGTRVAYKKRTGRLGGWQLAVLDLATGVETLLPGTGGVDDQAAWEDGDMLLYGVPSASGRPPAVYRAAADGTGTPALVAESASSPVPAPA